MQYIPTVQWGFSGEINGPANLTFPISFTSVPFAVLSEADAAYSSRIDYTDFSTANLTNTKFQIVSYDLSVNNYGPTSGWWIAIGV